AIAEVNEVVSEIVALACAKQRQGVSVEGALLDLVQLPDISRVDRCDDMDPPGLIEGRWPGFRRARPDIPELQGAGGHALDEFVGEHFKRRTRRPEDAQSLVGQANVETGVRLGCPPIPCRDLRNAVVAAGYGGGEPAPGRDAIGDFKNEVAHVRLAIATQDIALQISEVKYSTHQPNPSCLRTWATENPG